MFTARKKGRLAIGAAAVGAVLALAGCASGDPLDSGSGGGAEGDTIVVGSQDYYSNAIIAEIYAQALENAGFDVERQFRIGQRDAYMPEVENGSISLFPEYTGNLLQFYDTEATATEPDAVYDALVEELPEGLTALDYSPATDQDSYNVTADFAEQNDVTSIADLAGIEGLTLGGAPELAERPYGPSGLESVYGVNVEFSATGETTVDALNEGVVDIANIYSADPSIAEFGFVTLEDPEGLFLASNVVPIVSSDIADEIADVINEVSAALTPEGLVELNLQSTQDQLNEATIATQWLEDNGFTD
jgi:osmoprotectant transport system substrate-binding protein